MAGVTTFVVGRSPVEPISYPLRELIESKADPDTTVLIDSDNQRLYYVCAGKKIWCHPVELLPQLEERLGKCMAYRPSDETFSALMMRHSQFSTSDKLVPYGDELYVIGPLCYRARYQSKVIKSRIQEDANPFKTLCDIYANFGPFAIKDVDNFLTRVNDYHTRLLDTEIYVVATMIIQLVSTNKLAMTKQDLDRADHSLALLRTAKTIPIISASLGTLLHFQYLAHDKISEQEKIEAAIPFADFIDKFTSPFTLHSLLDFGNRLLRPNYDSLHNFIAAISRFLSAVGSSQLTGYDNDLLVHFLLVTFFPKLPGMCYETSFNLRSKGYTCIGKLFPRLSADAIDRLETILVKTIFPTAVRNTNTNNETCPIMHAMLSPFIGTNLTAVPLFGDWLATLAVVPPVATLAVVPPVDKPGVVSPVDKPAVVSPVDGMMRAAASSRPVANDLVVSGDQALDRSLATGVTDTGMGTTSGGPLMAAAESVKIVNRVSAADSSPSPITLVGSPLQERNVRILMALRTPHDILQASSTLLNDELYPAHYTFIQRFCTYLKAIDSQSFNGKESRNVLAALAEIVVDMPVTARPFVRERLGTTLSQLYTDANCAAITTLVELLSE